MFCWRSQEPLPVVSPGSVSQGPLSGSPWRQPFSAPSLPRVCFPLELRLCSQHLHLGVSKAEHSLSSTHTPGPQLLHPVPLSVQGRRGVGASTLPASFALRHSVHRASPSRFSRWHHHDRTLMSAPAALTQPVLPACGQLQAPPERFWLPPTRSPFSTQQPGDLFRSCTIMYLKHCLCPTFLEQNQACCQD